MRDITDLMQRHRECARHIWNSYFQPQAKADDDWDLRDRFEEINAKLFSALVLWPLERNEREPAPANWEPLKPIPFIRVVPDGDCPILINRETSSGYWDHPIESVVESDIDMRFIHYFDWSAIGPRDFEFLRVFIIGSADHPDLKGRHALVKPLHVRIHFDDAVA